MTDATRQKSPEQMSCDYAERRGHFPSTARYADVALAWLHGHSSRDTEVAALQARLAAQREMLHWWSARHPQDRVAFVESFTIGTGPEDA